NSLLASYCREMKFVSRPFRPRISYQLGVATVDKASASPLANAFSTMLVDSIMAAVRPQDHTRRLGGA
ncbi:MAG: LysR family transcriptional regulator, partial [Ramlibacter sp.]